MSKYSIIYMDAPWNYRDKANSGKRGSVHKYPVLSEKYLRSLPVGDIAEDNCALFFWITAPKLIETCTIPLDWGFTYKTVAFTWIKINKKSGTLFWGMGNWTRANAEFCLLYTKGKPRRVRADVHSVVVSPFTGKHSEKPALVRDRITKLMGNKSKIEIFSREKIVGWDSIGYDIDRMDIKDSLNKIITRG